MLRRWPSSSWSSALPTRPRPRPKPQRRRRVARRKLPRRRKPSRPPSLKKSRSAHARPLRKPKPKRRLLPRKSRSAPAKRKKSKSLSQTPAGRRAFLFALEKLSDLVGDALRFRFQKPAGRRIQPPQAPFRPCHDERVV